MKRIIGVLCAMLWLIALAQDDSVRVSFVTFYPGSEVFELYGHAELRVTQGNNDYYFNYGVFNFDAPNFTGRFLAGETDYMCVAVPAQYATMGMDGRKMVEQDLNLSQEQAVRLRDALVINAMPANRTYRYRYFGDNCSTRPRDMIESVLDSAVSYSPLAADTAVVTLRDIVSHYNRNYPWEQLAIDLALGSEVDEPISGRQAMFVPMLLMQALDGATVTRDGTVVPLVTRTRVMVAGSDDGTVLPPTPWYHHPITVFTALWLVTLALVVVDLKRRKMCFKVFDTALFTVAGLMGCLLFYLVFFSTHEATSPNWNLMWLNPMYLVAAVAVWVKRWQRVMDVVLVMLGVAAVCCLVSDQHFNFACLPIIASLVTTADKYHLLRFIKKFEPK